MALLEGRGINSYLHADAKQADGLLCKPMYLLIENSLCSTAYYKMSIYEQMLVKS